MTKQLHDGDDSGVIIGASATQKVAFFGETPVTQQVLAVGLTSTNTTAASVAAAVVEIRNALRSLGLVSYTG